MHFLYYPFTSYVSLNYFVSKVLLSIVVYRVYSILFYRNGLLLFFEQLCTFQMFLILYYTLRTLIIDLKRVGILSLLIQMSLRLYIRNKDGLYLHLVLDPILYVTDG